MSKMHFKQTEILIFLKAYVWLLPLPAQFGKIETSADLMRGGRVFIESEPVSCVFTKKKGT